MDAKYDKQTGIVILMLTGKDCAEIIREYEDGYKSKPSMSLKHTQIFPAKYPRLKELVKWVQTVKAI